MKVLIIGGNRFVGKALAQKILWEDTFKDRYNHGCIDVFNRSGTSPRRVNAIKGDRNNIEDLKKINFNKYDCIVDMCLYKLEQFRLMRELIPNKVRYIFVSSGAVKYKDTFGSYTVEKEGIETELKGTDLNYTIVRPSYVVGYGNHIMRLEYFIDKLIDGEDIKIDNGDCSINLVDVDDVAECLKHIILSTNDLRGKIYEIGNDTETTVNEIIDIIKKELNIEGHTTQESDESVFPNQLFKIDNRNIKIEFGIKFNNINDIIKSFIERWKSEN